jgi:DNA-binding YbaB/EbfC family protein
VTVNGKGELKRISLDPQLMDPADTEVVEDLIIAAFADAKAKVETHVAAEMAKLTGGLKLPPGLKLPF